MSQISTFTSLRYVVAACATAALLLHPVPQGGSPAFGAETAGAFSPTGSTSTAPQKTGKSEVAVSVSPSVTSGEPAEPDEVRAGDVDVTPSQVLPVEDGNVAVLGETTPSQTSPTSSVESVSSAASTIEVTEETETPRGVGGITNWRPAVATTSSEGREETSESTSALASASVPAPRAEVRPTLTPPPPQPPVPAPRAEVRPTLTPPPPPAASVPVRQAQDSPSALARTGANVDKLLWLSSILIVAGAALLTLRRRDGGPRHRR